MKKLLLALVLFLAPSIAFAQCTGVFPANTVCGNLSASPAPPRAVSISSSGIIGPGSSTIGHFATWGNITGNLLADFDLFGTANTWTAGQILAGASTFSAANTFSNTNTFSSTVKFTGLSAGTQTKCLGLDSGDNVVSLTGQCNQSSSPDSIANCSLAAAVAGNALTISLKDQTGADPSASSPCVVSFRSATAATGTYSAITVTAALSFSTGSSGSTFGSTNSVPFRLWITAWNNAGTLVLGVSKQSAANNIYPINEGTVQTSTTCSACTNATSSGVYYTTAGQSAKAIRILGYMDWASGLATAGTWASGPTTIQMFGAGVNKPGEVLQTVYAASQALTVGSGMTPTPTDAIATITPTSAPNIVEASASGSMLQSGVSGYAISQMYRAAGASGVCTTAIGSKVNGGVNAGIALSPTSLLAFDRPGVATQITYVVCISNSTADNSQWCSDAQTTQTCNIIVKEIMG